jgi:molybdenum cofactor cytidylyltransferase
MIVGIILAAGMSTRMGVLKQLLPLGGKAAVQVVVERVASRLDKVLVVLGHRAGEVACVLTEQSVECVVNPEYRLGMASSVKCGIQAAGQATAYLICLGDQPGIDLKVIDAVVAAAGRTGRGIVIPTYQGRRGHPILIDHSYAEEILVLPQDRGLNQVTRGHPGDTLEIPLAHKEVLEDMDTPEDYQRELARFQSNLRA